MFFCGGNPRTLALIVASPLGGQLLARVTHDSKPVIQWHFPLTFLAPHQQHLTTFVRGTPTGWCHLFMIAASTESSPTNRRLCSHNSIHCHCKDATMTKFTLLIGALAAVSSSQAFVIGTNKQQQQHASSTQLYGLIDDLKLIFSEEGKANRAAYEEQQRKEMEEAQREILERRTDPEKMGQYEQEIRERRAKLMQEKEVYKFQSTVQDGVDPIDEWKRKRESGEIVVGDDLERDASSERLGSEGLQEVRVDERMPYIDQGYVDEEADVMGNVSDRHNRRCVLLIGFDMMWNSWFDSLPCHFYDKILNIFGGGKK